MSTNVALRQRPVFRVPSTVTQEDHAPSLRVIEGTTPKRARTPLLLIGLLVIVISIAVPMILQTRMAQTAFEIHEYQLEINAINAQTWRAQSELRTFESAQVLEEKARALGMVPARVSGTISLSTQTVDGGIVAR